MTTFRQGCASEARSAAVALMLLGAWGIAAAIVSAADIAAFEVMLRGLPALLVVGAGAGAARAGRRWCVALALLGTVGGLWFMIMPVHVVVAGTGTGVVEWLGLFFAPGVLMMLLSVRILDAVSEPAGAPLARGGEQALDEIYRALCAREALERLAGPARRGAESERRPRGWVVEHGSVVLYDRAGDGRWLRRSRAVLTVPDGSTTPDRRA